MLGALQPDLQALDALQLRWVAAAHATPWQWRCSTAGRGICGYCKPDTGASDQGAWLVSGLLHASCTYVYQVALVGHQHRGH